jgi:hypothetical protein
MPATFRAAGFTRTPASDAPNHLFVIYADHRYDGDAAIRGDHGIEGRGLHQIAREAIHDRTPGCVRLLEPILNHADGHFVGHQRPRVHVALCQLPQLRLILQIEAEDVASRDLRQLRRVFQQLRLGAFPGARCAQQNDEHALLSHDSSSSRLGVFCTLSNQEIGLHETNLLTKAICYLNAACVATALSE